MKLLYHVCDYKVDILYPNNYGSDAIFLSENNFICALGRFLYIFDYEVLKEFFNIENRSSAGLGIYNKSNLTKTYYHFMSKYLGKEYLIREPIDVNKFALGVAVNFDVCMGKFEEFFMDEVNKRENQKLKRI